MKSARRVAVILWMTLLCRSNDRAGRRDFEPSSPGLGSFNAKNSTLSRITRRCFRIYFVAGLRPIKTKKQSLSRMQAFIKDSVSLFLHGLMPNTKKSARRGSNPRPPPWQGGAPPLSHSRIVRVRHTQEK